MFQVSEISRAGRLVAAALCLAGSGAAYATISLNSLAFPATIGRGQTVTVDVAWTRTNAAASTFTVDIPPQVQVAPPALPADCVLLTPTRIQCTVAAGAITTTGITQFQIRGAVLGGLNLTASSAGSPDASTSGDVTTAGDLTIVKTKTAPSSNPVTGQSTSFNLAPNLALADDVPAGASVVVTDNLPGTVTDFNLTSVGTSGLTPSCTATGAANTSRSLTCTYNGPFTVAAFNASSIALVGTPGNTGDFINVSSIASGSDKYFDSNGSNNISNVAYSVTPGADMQALGTMPVNGVVLNSPQTLTISFKNNGPLNAPAGGTVSTIIPAGFGIGVLPLGCASTGAGPTTITCTAGVVNNGNTESFAIPLTMPNVPVAGNFPVTITPPAGFGDSNPANNTVQVPYRAVVPFADLSASKTKAPGGPQAPGTLVTTTMTITNDPASSNPATYTIGQPLRIVDYLKPEEVAGGTISGVSANWACVVTTGVTPPTNVSAAQSTRVVCTSTDAGALAVGASRSVSFSSNLTLGASLTPISLPNTACTGGSALTALGLLPAAAPQPPDANTANDCANDNVNLVVTPVVVGEAQASIQKLSSVDNTTFIDPVGAAPTLPPGANTVYWRMVVTTPTVGANPLQKDIPTLRLIDVIPGRQNALSSGAPAPDFITPPILVTTTPSTFGTCPNLAAGNADGLNCSFTNVPPGTTISINLAVQRPIASGTLTNTATLSSPNSLLSPIAGGQLSDAAAVIVTPRVDVALTTKIVTPATPRIGELVQFTLTSQNLGPDDVTAANQFTVTDNVNPTPTPALVGYEVISVTGAGMNCAASNLATGALSCTNTGPVARYEVRTINITARIKKPSGALPPNGNVYTNQTNTATVALTGGYCEYKTETQTNALVSTACNDANSTSNNAKTATFDVLVPSIDLKQRKERILPALQSAFALGDPLRYRFRIQSNGPSRAEGVVMTDRLTVPAGYFVEMVGAGGFPRTVTPLLVNANAPEGGYALDTTKTATVRCTQTAVNADIVCRLDTVAANNFLDAAKEVNFELTFNATPTTGTAPVSFGNRAFVCADETTAYESSGSCSDVPATAGNNLAAVNDTVFPKTDLDLISKNTITAGPVDINQPVQFTIITRNGGPTTGVKMRLVDTLPSGFEWVNTGPQAPTVVVNGGSTATLSGPLTVSSTVPANGTDNVCYISNGITNVTSPTQQQAIQCDIGGLFPPGFGDTITLTLFARPKGGVYDGSAAAPYGVDRTNTATVLPGRDTNGNEISIDPNSGNNTRTSVIQVRNAQIGGRTFSDMNNNGDQNGLVLGQDLGIGNVTFTLTGTDLYGYPMSRTVTSDNSAGGAGSTRGDYLFTNLPPSNAAGYTITQSQPPDFVNATPQPNTSRPVRNGASTGISGPITVANNTGPDTSVISGVRLAGGGNGVQFDFPELLKPLLSGFVYLDTDNTGVKTAPKPGINGVTMTVIGCAAGPNGVVNTAGPINAGPVVCAGDDVPVSLTTQTYNDPIFGAGFYKFAVTDPGRYSIIEQAAQPPYGGGTTLRGKTTAGSVDLLPSAAGSNDGGTPGTANATLTGAGGSPGLLQEFAGTVTASQIRDILIPNRQGLSVNNNFGEVQPGKISGVVYTENGAPNSNYGPGVDFPYAGMPISLSGTDELGQAVSFNTVTDTSGAYEFPNLRPGTYLVSKSPSAGIVNETGGAFPGTDAGNAVRGNRVNDNTIGNITLAPGTVVSNTNFALVNGGAPLAQITAFVYIDTNRDNIAQGTETTRIPGVTVRLVQGSSCETGTVLQTAQTAADGSVSFMAPVGGNYLLCQVQPPGYANGNANGAPGSNTIVINNLQLVGSTGNSFGEWGASLAGSVYEDIGTAANPALANNGVRDPGEAGIPNVPVTLTGLDINGLPVNFTTTTDAQGTYVFDNLIQPGPAGYTVTEGVIPAASGIYTDGKDTAGNASLAPGNATAVNDQTSGIRFAPGERTTGYNFGELKGAFISGVVYVDSNRNNGLDAADPARIGGVTIRLVQGASCETGTVLQTTTTSATGSYFFGGLTPGASYLVCETQPAGYGNGNANGTPASNVISITNLAPTGSTNNNFGELVGSIAGVVYLDNNNNGVRDPGEPGIPGVAVTLTGVDINGNAVNRTVATDATGNYIFDSILTSGVAGYKVTEQVVQPVAPGTQTLTFNGITTPGNVGGTSTGVATPVSVTPSAVSGIVLPPGGQSVDNNFGEVLVQTPDLVVSKTSNKPVFTEGNTSGYTLKAKNIGAAPTVGTYTVVDRLSASGVPAKWAIESASGAGWACTISADKQQVSCDSSQVLASGQENPSPIRLTVSFAQGAAAFSPLRNTVSVAGGGEPADKAPQPGELAAPKPCGPGAEFNVCQLATPVQISAGLNGHVWIDGSNKTVLDTSDKRLPGWIVEIYDLSAPGAAGQSFTDLVRNGNPTRTTTTDAQGFYQFCGLEPGSQYRVLFRDPANRVAFPGVVTNEGGRTTGADYFSQVKTLDGFQVLQVTLPAAPTGAVSNACNVTAPEQSLPLDPNGVFYDSTTRQPVPGATVTLVPEGVCTGYDPRLHIINYETYAKDAAGNPSMTVGADGFYKFLLSGDPSTPRACTFRLVVTAPPGYSPPPSSVIAPQPPLATPAGPGVINVQPQQGAPTGNQSTNYHLVLNLGLNLSEVFNNHIPLDPIAAGALSLTKTGDKRVVEVGDTVLYTIQVRQSAGGALAQATVLDRLPPGFTLVRSTARIDGISAPDPLGGLGPTLAFNLGRMSAGQTRTLTYRVRVGVGSQQGDGINRAQAQGCQVAAGCVNANTLLPIATATASNEARYQVQVSGGVFTTSACVAGKVFVDCNNNHVQDPEEMGIPGVRLYLETGASMISDVEGKYSMCGLSPRSHVIKVDPITLPRGSRLTTSSNRNLGDAGSLFLDLKNGELGRADFVEGSCSNPVLEQVRARRAQGEIRSVETEGTGAGGLRFESKPAAAPQQATDSANQPLVQPRATQNPSSANAAGADHVR